MGAASVSICRPFGGHAGAFRLGRAMSDRERGAAQVFGPLHLDEHTEALLFRIALFLRLDESLPDLLIYRAGLVDFRGPIEPRNAAPRQQAGFAQRRLWEEDGDHGAV